MGTTDSKQKLGERVIAARRKLNEDIKLQSERSKQLQTQSPQTMQDIIKSIAESFQSYSPFLEATLLIAWTADPQQCQNIIISACQKVLSAPIQKDEYEWFMSYVFPSSIWMYKTEQNRYMYQDLIETANAMQKGIIDSMNSIYDHLPMESIVCDQKPKHSRQTRPQKCGFITGQRHNQCFGNERAKRGRRGFANLCRQ